MPTTTAVLNPVLAQYAQQLLEAGFKVYLPQSDVKRVANGGRGAVGTWFSFSREVDGQTCYASVSTGFFNAPSFTMPIKPSREHGSGMFVGTNPDRNDALDVATATRYASPSNWNDLVGTHANYNDTRFNTKVEVTA